MRVNMPAIFLIGTGLWGLAAAVIAVWLALGSGAEESWLGVCGAGAAIGLIGWGWSRWRRW